MKNNEFTLMEMGWNVNHYPRHPNALDRTRGMGNNCSRGIKKGGIENDSKKTGQEEWAGN